MSVSLVANQKIYRKQRGTKWQILNALSNFLVTLGLTQHGIYSHARTRVFNQIQVHSWGTVLNSLSVGSHSFPLYSLIKFVSYNLALLGRSYGSNGLLLTGVVGRIKEGSDGRSKLALYSAAHNKESFLPFSMSDTSTCQNVPHALACTGKKCQALLHAISTFS